jgi:hypothetical protein
MLRRLLASALFLGSAIALIPSSANAQTVNVPFSGAVLSNCTFGTPVPGTLSLSGTTLSSSSTPGNVPFTCTAPANITFSAPIQTGGPAFTPSACLTNVGTLGSPTTGLNTCTGTSTPSAITTTGPNNAIVGMSVTSPNALATGTYTYNVTLTITP